MFDRRINRKIEFQWFFSQLFFNWLHRVVIIEVWFPAGMNFYKNAVVKSAGFCRLLFGKLNCVDFLGKA